MSTPAAITLSLHGGPRTFESERDVFNAAHGLHLASRESALAHARAVFALGELLVAFVEHVRDNGGRTSVVAAATAASVPHRSAHRAEKWYHAFRGEGGGFCEDLWRERQHEVTRAVQAGRRGEPRRDGDGDASVTAVQQVLGHRSAPASRVPTMPAAPTNTTTPTTNTNTTPATRSAVARALAETRSRYGLRPAPSREPVTGPQLELDFDLRADARELAATVEALEHDAIAPERARRVHEAIRAAIDAATQTAGGVA